MFDNMTKEELFFEMKKIDELWEKAVENYGEDAMWSPLWDERMEFQHMELFGILKERRLYEEYKTWRNA